MHTPELKGLLRFVGPAVLASVAYSDPGNFATKIQAGAQYGYELLWVVVLASLIAMLFQATAAKVWTVTGRNLAELCRDNFPKPVVWCMWAADSDDCGQPFRALPQFVWCMAGGRWASHLYCQPQMPEDLVQTSLAVDPARPHG